ncbi:GNAT family N-acetyltransferase [uncultured Oscillibacter sp.]|uniref:GNAT family N-acetyltransferase n=1 Tax=uncultured Oscillibacter sp. TaxID=876091 RepID=UPI0025D7F63A|nr:GNAT family N-acetyltransferase [uncultured Oscillibacter sp.]
MRAVPLSAAHLEGVAALWREAAVIRYTNVPGPCGPAESRRRLDQLLACQAGLPAPTIFALEEGGRFCGIAGCPPVETGVFGLFYQLSPACWGRGLGLRGASLALEALERQFPAPEVRAEVVAENAASVHILERLGFWRTGVRPGAFCREGRLLDVWTYLRCTGGGKERPV